VLQFVYCHVYEWLWMGLWMVIRFIEHLQNVTTNNYDSLTVTQTKDHCHCSTHKVFSVFTSRCSQQLPTADIPFPLVSPNCPCPQLSASNSNRSRWLYSSSPLTNSHRLTLLTDFTRSVGQLNCFWPSPAESFLASTSLRSMNKIFVLS
jgi:hypothetical protein